MYDYQIFSLQKYGGISRYFYELIKQYECIENIEVKVPLLVSNNHYISDKRYVQHINLLPNKEFRGKHRLLAPINKINSIQKIKMKNYDVFHPTYYDPYFLKYIGATPFILTVYDMIHEKFSEFVSKNDLAANNKKILLEKASKIIAISENTKKDLIEIFKISAEKITVVHLATSMKINNDFKIKIKLPSKYILFVGTRQGYKNFSKFIKAVSKIIDKEMDLYILCVGAGKFTSDEINLFNELSIKDKVLQFDLDDESLSQFYKNALMFVFPSLYEGFGIPILEAFACQCPLVCSNTSSFPEVAEDAAEYFDPYSELSIYQAIENVLENEEQRKLLVENGTKRLKYFSWEQTALETKKVYESTMK
ncbi:glycosyltransferase family 1 protein [Sulfurimonas sp.]|uniref:glycosyltransferase family 4 protein n=1 Tax=Sulfurimonas sp. TaxID=2022749 RepID=UPI002AB1C9C9|nr:glycosyltransferase family 1 protein [Sulfurimonas sp.]